MSYAKCIKTSKSLGLNPYCNGRYSLSYQFLEYEKRLTGLNPYCNGRYSLSCMSNGMQKCAQVLILIVMEDTH